MNTMLQPEGFQMSFRHSVSEGELAHESLIETQDLSCYREVGRRTKPLRWQVEVEQDHFFGVMNIEGAALCRVRNGDRVQPLIGRSMYVGLGPIQIDCLLGRGRHHRLMFSWPASGTRSLARYWNEFVTSVNTSHLGFVYCAKDTLAGDNYDLLSSTTLGYRPRSMSKVFGMLFSLSGEALTQVDGLRTVFGVRDSFPVSLARLIEDVHKSPGKDWALREAAISAGYSQYHLSRTFRAHVGMGFPAFVEQVRTRRALEEILRSHAPLDEIALDAGFAGAQNMRDAFRTELGFLPSEVRSFHHGAGAMGHENPPASMSGAEGSWSA